MTIARALVRRPEILILDDASSALDFATDAALRGGIKEYCPSTTVFLISQRAGTVMHAAVSYTHLDVYKRQLQRLHPVQSPVS